MDPNNLVEMLSQTVERYPDKEALMWKQNGSYTSMTYQGFWDHIKNTAFGLASIGVKPDDKVAILANSNPKWAISDFAIASLGAVSVPIYPTLPSNQVSYVLDNGDCTVAIVENDEQLQKVKDGETETQHTVVMDDANVTLGNKVSSFDALEEKGARKPLENWEDRWKEIPEDQLMTIIHTSGTTGPPKGVMLSHENFLSNMKAIQFWLIELKAEDVHLSYLPVSHVFERMAGHYMPLFAGTTIAYAESIDTIQENMQEVKPTIMTSVPRLFEKVYAKVVEQIESGSPVKQKIFRWALGVGEQRYDYYMNTPVQELLLNNQMPKKLQRNLALADRLVYQKIKERLGGRMRGMVTGGGTLNPEIAKFFWSLDIPILEGYGLTETSPVVTTNPMSRAKVGTTGKPIPNVKVRIASDGEVLVKGPNVMQGYYKNKEATDKDIVDGWFHTGDIGALDEEGYLKIVDRKKRILVLSTGKNVAPAPIESVINESRYIEFAAVIGDGRKYVTALVTPDMENLVPWAKDQGIQTESREELCARDDVQKLLKDEVARLTETAADYETPKKVVVIGEEWTVEGGELTPKLSLRMKNIEEKYSKSIEEAYGDASISAKEVAAEAQ
ncbi:long-chain fatty acid--CoA ligase [Salicibibacter halophilus]|uniref:Acyl-CoA synthetase n=1 Tax=Salicibibacter halophilus TaxID=2502791 RepID=A0A514LJQ4_9BACI|nr:long-chain fatty acid--CoA ligase [Salicibibacter halophilus]QDI92052.1 long-chain fatty acid--CoA ligase [Salicibibacter halophilus]